ncbi:MAG: hypothetical protein IT209_02090 [Armatimonadetes bacterium]|nr:hypothetical protein [Armatimonadota bacterium]
MSRYVLAASGLLFFAASPGFCHQRPFIHTYESWTSSKGSWSISVHTDFAINSRRGGRDFRNQIELGNGTTERWANAVYLVSQKDYSKNLKFDAVRFKSIYRLARHNRLALDPALYLGYKLKADSEKADEMEGRLVLSKDVRRNHYAYNIIVEKRLASGQSYRHGYALGWARDTNFGALGVEVYGSYSDRTHQIAPVVAFPFGKKNWWVAALVFPLNGRSQPVTLRTALKFKW